MGHHAIGVIWRGFPQKAESMLSEVWINYLFNNYTVDQTTQKFLASSNKDVFAHNPLPAG